jgi:hypothetical protein
MAASVLIVATLGGIALAQSCPNVVQYGQRPPSVRMPGETRGVRAQVTYFKTADRDAFIKEDDERRKSPSVLKLRSTDFAGELAMLEQQGTATSSTRLSRLLYLGDTGEFNLPTQITGATINVGFASLPGSNARRWFELDRATAISVKQRPGERFYRVELLSTFVQLKPEGGADLTVDLDAGAFLEPGETIIYKLMSDFEVARAGSWRTYIALALDPKRF